MKILLTVVFAAAFMARSMASVTNPPDTTTNFVDRSSALMSIDQGKKLLADGKVREALLLFREAAVKDPNSWKPQYWLAYCHYRLNNFGYARQYGEAAVAKGNGEVDVEIYDILGSSYHRLSSLDSAKMCYEKAVAGMTKSRLRELGVERKLAECDFAKEALAKTPNQRVALRGDVNSGFNEYAPILSSNGKVLYFTSRRGNTTGGKVNPDDQEYFEDIYRAQWNESKQMWDSISNNIERLNSAGFDALSNITADGLHATLTVNNTATNAKKQTRSSDIFEAEYTDKGRWNAPRAIQNKTINSSFFDGAATITADGSTMYFVSDRKAEKRMTDIYVVKKEGKKWGEAVPVSDSINTAGKETTPFITPDGRFLFFSSDGRTGMGGMDVYVCENTGSGWSAPMNLGAAVNSVNDDTHFRVYKDLNKILMASYNIQGQKSSMDMYEIDLSKAALPVRW
jgi:Tol biopolymer transport system component